MLREYWSTKDKIYLLLYNYCIVVSHVLYSETIDEGHQGIEQSIVFNVVAWYVHATCQICTTMFSMLSLDVVYSAS